VFDYSFFVEIPSSLKIGNWFFVADDFSSNSSNSHPLSDFIPYHTYKIKDKSIKKPPEKRRHQRISLIVPHKEQKSPFPLN